MAISKTHRDGWKATEIQDAHAAEQNDARRQGGTAKNRDRWQDSEVEINFGNEAAGAGWIFSEPSRKAGGGAGFEAVGGEFHYWMEKKSKPDEFKELNTTRELLKKQGDAIATTEQEMNILIQKHNANHQNLNSIFFNGSKTCASFWHLRR